MKKIIIAFVIILIILGISALVYYSMTPKYLNQKSTQNNISQESDNRSIGDVISEFPESTDGDFPRNIFG